MKKMKRLSALLLTAALSAQAFAIPVLADSNVKPTSISAVGSTSQTISKGSKIELKVKMNPLYAEDDYLNWSIVSGQDVVAFTDEPYGDDEVDLKALKAGTAKVKCSISGTSKEVDFTITVGSKPAEKKLKKIGKAKRQVTAGSDFELKVKKVGQIRKSDLIWSIVSGTDVVCFDEDMDDIYDDEVEFRALKPGTAKIRCKIRGTKKKVVFVVTVGERTNRNPYDHDDDHYRNWR